MSPRLVTPARACPVCAGHAAHGAWREAGLRYVRCAACSAFFSDVTEAYYDAHRHNAWDEAVPDADTVGFYDRARRPSHEALLQRMPATGAGRLLDVGCGLGFFLQRAAASGWTATGVEPSSAWAAASRERPGVADVVCGLVEDPALDGRRFELITVWDVLEHIFDPVPFLARVRSLLAPGGQVFIRTPNLGYLRPVYGARRRLGQDVRLGPLNHVVYFSPATLTRALAAAGLRPERWHALPPPQVNTLDRGGEDRFAARSPAVRAKNAWARLADVAVTVTRGRIAVASDLDVVAAAGT